MKEKPRVLIVDDNNELLSGLKLFLSPHVGEIVTLRNPNLIPSTLQQSGYDLIMLDMNFTAGVNNGNEGLYWMKRILDIDPASTIILITGYGDIELAVKAIREGAADFIQKSWDEERILSSVFTALKIRESRQEIKSLKNKTRHLEEKILHEADICRGKSPAMQQVFHTLEKVASTDANILILEKTGQEKKSPPGKPICYLPEVQKYLLRWILPPCPKAFLKVKSSATKRAPLRMPLKIKPDI